jgi:hypothetical protein
VITVCNQSTRVTNSDVQLMVRACWAQLRDHAAPKWRLTPMPVVYATDASAAPPGSWVIAVLDNSDQANALGYHDVTQNDVVYGKVFAGPVLDNGGNALTAPLSVASVLSHEVLETFVDPACNGWRDTLRGYSIALEVGDPVESDSYAIPVDGTPVTVSNFVTEKWFDPFATRRSGGFDYLNRCTAPFQMTRGGYIIRMTDGKVTQQFGEHFPEWKKAGKEFKLARTARREATREQPSLIGKIADAVR